uniref:Fibronectin type-III domain-containing protein n=1 Tax=Echinostoma caproni TaxID=27848 RepID=A0A183B8M9_9TREM
LVIQPGLLTAVWPANEPTVRGYALRWTVNGFTETKKDLPPSQRNYSLINIDPCTNVSIEVLKTEKDLSEKLHAQIHLNDTDNLMLQPVVTYLDNKLFLDWSDIWRCTKATTFNLTMKTQSGHVVYEEHDIRNTFQSITYRPDCEQTEVCITAGTVSRQILGMRCVADIRPFRRDKPSKPRLEQKENGDLSIEFTWSDSCSPSLVSVIIRSKTHSEVVRSSRSKTDSVNIPYPKWCSNCLVYVVASYPHLQDEISEPEILMGKWIPDITAYKNLLVMKELT